MPDGCDACPGFDDLADGDVDGVPDSCDTCPDVSDPGQEDSDGDSYGDACDNCPAITNPNQQISVAVTGDVNVSGAITSAELLISFIWSIMCSKARRRPGTCVGFTHSAGPAHN